MSSTIIRRQYPILGLSFRDFWDICSRFQTVHPEYRHVYFTVDGFVSFMVLDEPEVEFGKPCEVLALVIDIRGFSLFSEKPEIESPYTCGLMSAFYHMANRALQRFPPDMTKFLGDGVLAIWETTPTERELAVNVALQAALDLHNKWKIVMDSPHFTRGSAGYWRGHLFRPGQPTRNRQRLHWPTDQYCEPALQRLPRRPRLCRPRRPQSAAEYQEGGIRCTHLALWAAQRLVLFYQQAINFDFRTIRLLSSIRSFHHNTFASAKR